MGVHVQRHARVGVAYQVLQVLDVHAGVGVVCAECVPEHVGRDVGQGLVRVQRRLQFINNAGVSCK